MPQLATICPKKPKNATTGTKRIAVNQKVVQKAEELQELLGVSSISEVFGLLLTRYGQHLKQTWQYLYSPIDHPPPPITQQPEPAIQPVTQHQEPAPHPEIEEDPVIQRLAGLLDSF